MTKKKQKSPVPDADQPKPETQEAKGDPVLPEAKSPIQIPKEVLEQAKAFGIDLNQIVNWAEGMEQFKQVTLKNFEIIQKSFNELEPLVQLSKQIGQQQTQPAQTNAAAGAPGGANIIGLISQLAPFLTGGGGDKEFAELGKKAILSQISMSNAITNAVVAKIAGKATSEVAAALT